VSVVPDPTPTNGYRPLRYVCGIDAGATKTDCVISASDGTLVASRSEGPALMLTGDGFAATIGGAFDRCCATADIDPAAVEVVAVGLAGVDTSDGQAHARSALAGALRGGTLIVENDAGVALEAATATRPAAVIMAGTGSIGYGECPDGHSVRVGGWGHVLGDEGSGYAIGVAACAAVLKAVDGRGARTMLIDRARDHFSIEDVRDLVGLTERFALEPRTAAAFAPQVISLAQAGDGTAKQIVQRAATHLVGYARRLIDELQLQRRGVVMLGGGLLVRSPYYAGLLKQSMRAEWPEVTIGRFDLPPVGGAVLKALAGLYGREGSHALRAPLMRGFAARSTDRQPVVRRAK
jgi:glucosamine kinase